MKTKRKDIIIPHLGYTVKIRPFKNAPEEMPNALAFVKSETPHTCTLYLDFSKHMEAGDIAHELVHVLQFLCLHRNIDFVTETEHMGYLMGWMMGVIFNREYDV